MLGTKNKDIEDEIARVLKKKVSKDAADNFKAGLVKPFVIDGVSIVVRKQKSAKYNMYSYSAHKKQDT